MQTDISGGGSLVDRCQQREPAAFDELYEEYIVFVYKHIYYFVGSHAPTEALAEQVFLEAWQAFGRYQGRQRPILPRLLSIAHNLVTRNFRDGHREGQSIEGIFAESHFLLPGEADNSESQREKILAAILRLKAAERQVIMLRLVHGMEYADVAQALGKTVNSIQVIQCRALRNLHKAVTAPGNVECRLSRSWIGGDGGAEVR